MAKAAAHAWLSGCSATWPKGFIMRRICYALYAAVRCSASSAENSALNTWVCSQLGLLPSWPAHLPTGISHYPHLNALRPEGGGVEKALLLLRQVASQTIPSQLLQAGAWHSSVPVTILHFYMVPHSGRWQSPKVTSDTWKHHSKAPLKIK